jgi:hypothetical protein
VIFLREVSYVTLRSFEHSTTWCHARHHIDAPFFGIFAPSLSFPTNKTLLSQVVRLQMVFFVLIVVLIFLREVSYVTLRSFEHSTTWCHARHHIDAPFFGIFAPSLSFPTNKTLLSQVVRLQMGFFGVDCCVDGLFPSW